MFLAKDGNPLKIQNGQHKAWGKLQAQILLVLISLFMGGPSYAMDSSQSQLSHLVKLSLQELMTQKITTISKTKKKITDPTNAVVLRGKGIERHGLPR